MAINRNRCYGCDKGVAFGNNVSHANNKTRRTWKPNLQVARVRDRRQDRQGEGLHALPARRQGPARSARQPSLRDRRTCVRRKGSAFGAPFFLYGPTEHSDPRPLHADRADHRDHRTGRLVPRRAAARQGLPRRRHGPAQLDDRASSASRHLIDRLELVSADLLDQHLARSTPCATCQPDEIYNLAAQSFVRTSWTQPVLTGEFTALGVTRMLEAIEAGCARRALLPGQLQRDVRQGRRDAAARDDAVLPAQPVRRGQGLRPLDHGELPRELRPVRRLGHPVQPREPAARPRVRDPQDHRRAWRASSSGSQTELRLGNLDARRDWGFAGDYVEAMWLMLQQPSPTTTLWGWA